VNITNWRQVKEILNSALDLDASEREAYLAAVCSGDSGLRQEVEDLLHSYRSEFMEQPIVADQEADSDLAMGSILGRYEIIRMIGLGGMGKVYLATDNHLDRKVAIKVLNQKYENHQTNIQRFIQEAKAASALNHPNILTIHDIGQSETGRFIVMELVAGRPLSAIIATDNSIATILSLGSQMAKALSAAHAAGITHRDIKPDNIMVREDGYLKILDFGLARLVPVTDTGDEAAALMRQTTPGAVLGTVAYMSPEQARGEPAGPPTDIFALGIVFYELVTGRHPFRAETPLGMLHLINSQTPASPSSITEGATSALDELILRMLAKDARLRPTAPEVDRALSRISEASGASSLRQRDVRASIVRHTVGREQERNELRAAYRSACSGRGSLLCVAGEPGIGKTTLVEDLLSDLGAEERCTIARGRCSERLAGTEAYLPFLEALESLLRDAHRAEMEPAMRQIAPTWYAQVAPRSADSEEIAQLLADVKTASQARMKRELGSFFQEAARLRPLVLFFDDLQWADGSTIDLVSFLAAKLDAMNMLIVAAYRPSDMLLAKHPFLQLKPDLQARGVCRELLLDFLQEEEIAEYLELEFPGHRFPPEFPKLIHAKTEGSPLFMADLVRYLRDRGVIAMDGASWTLAQTLPDIERELPESVRGMIERKIGQLTEEDRKLLTAASVQGYEFDSAVVGQTLGLGSDEVEERLENLERVFSFVKLIDEADFPDRTLTLKYRFVHALYQHSLFAGLRLTRKASLSSAVAKSLEKFYGKQSTNVANELAVLWAAGREYARAADYFLKAANNATQVNAHREAIQLAHHGIEALQRLPEPSEVAPLELGLQLRLGFSLTTVDGWTSPEAQQAFTRAHVLCQQAGNEPRLFAALRGIWARHLIRGEYKTARPLADQLLELAQQADDSVLLGSACFGLGVTMCWQGELTAARQYCEQALDLYDPSRSKAYLAFSTQDMAVQAHYILAFCLWNLGFPDHALKQAQEALALAERLSHPHSLGAALHGLGLVYFWRGEWDPNQQQLTRARALAQENDLGDFVIWATLEHDLAQGFQIQSEASVVQVRRSLEAVRAKGLGMTFTSWLANVADLLGESGHIAAGLDLIDEALAKIEPTGERFWEAEIWRVKGDLLLQRDEQLHQVSNSETEAETCYLKAIEIARAQGAKSLELRSTMSLTRLLRRQGKRVEAQQMLAEIYGWFTQGFDTRDLRNAKALLNE
jgi:tRNA A-37 threonylcarbamoyl transferase component Bud32/tetratricopeptide (TPR) repeat protein